jgi:hypothetical protein
VTRRTRRAVGVGVTIVVLVAAVVVVGTHFWQIGRTIGPTCTIGVNGTAASVTFQGWTAPFVCQQVMDQLVSATGGAAGVVLARRPPAPATTPVACRYIVLNDTVTVRDEGALKIVGTLLCDGLATRARH